MKVLRWSVTEPKNQDLSCPFCHHPDDLLRPDLVQLLQETQPHQVSSKIPFERARCFYSSDKWIFSHYEHFRYLDVLYAEDGEESVDSPYVPEVLEAIINIASTILYL